MVDVCLVIGFVMVISTVRMEVMNQVRRTERAC
ncbi:hypothetical protein B566_EDAN017246 [Ephemera danica]|nr:hypothetical protein B566_EDAN017246 [Ephemera danica]